MKHPTTLLLEVTNRCNAKCLICARSWWKDEHAQDLDTLPTSTCCDIIDALPKTYRVKLGQYGEPLLHRELETIVHWASTTKRYVWTTTNGALLTPERSRGLLEAGLRKIIVSVDGVDKETYEAMRPGLSWDKLLANIEAFRRIRDEHGDGSRECPLIVNAVATKENGLTKDIVKAFWADKAEGSACVQEVDVSPPGGLLYMDGEPIDCERPFEHLTVRVNGDVVLCCRDAHASYVMGNVLSESPLQVFNGDRFEAARHSLLSGKAHPSICKDCRARWKHTRPPRRGPST
jgi:radical SAM protein with 4Fe4S-binding SPASM domain